MAGLAVFPVTFTGLSSAGIVYIPELKEGDIILSWHNQNGNQGENYFKRFVDTDGELEQFRNTDISANTYTAVVIRFI